VWTLVVAFAVVTTACALLFYVGTFHGWGIQPTFTSTTSSSLAPTVNFLDCLHFSFVTIATLGYGDYRPESYGRAIAAFEVLAGIVLMGVFISRLVSRQQDHIFRRLISGQFNSEIQDFRDQLKILLGDIKAAPPVLTKDHSALLFYRARGLTMAIARYWRHEASEPDLEEYVPLRAAGRLLGELILILEVLDTQSAGKSKADLHPDDFKAIRTITESVLVVSTVLSDRIIDQGLKHSKERVTILIKKLREQLRLGRKIYKVNEAHENQLSRPSTSDA
jgi:hypothetical protein